MAQQTVNWEYFNTLLAQHELTSFAHACFKNCPSLLPEGEADLLKINQYSVLAHLAGLEKEFLGILDIFQDQGIELLPLKGSAFLIDHIYGAKAGLRPMADIDILIKKENFAQAEGLAETLGYRKESCGFKENYWSENNYHIMLVKNKEGKRFSTLEIHWLLDYPRKILLLPSLWGRKRKLQVGGRQVCLLSPEDTLFSLALHLRRFGNVLSLKSACDFACLLTKYKDLDWNYILQEAKRGKMYASVYFRFVQANVLFNIQVPEVILKTFSPANYKRRLIEGFILKDTFSGQGLAEGSIFLKNHFLVYDNYWEPVRMIINMPQEQFAKFFRLAPYRIKTLLLYRLRFLGFPCYLLALILKAIIRKIVKTRRSLFSAG